MTEEGPTAGRIHRPLPPMGDVTPSCRAIGIVDSEVATLLVGTNRHQFQLAPEEVDITQADVKYVPVEVTRTFINTEGEIVEANIVAPKVPSAGRRDWRRRIAVTGARRMSAWLQNWELSR